MKFAILFGGQSYEHEISIVSSISLTKVIHNLEYFIFLDASRNFYLIDKDKFNAKFFSSGEYKSMPQLTLSQEGFKTEKKGLFGSSKVIAFDVLINMIHGADGEDGRVASLLEFYNVAYIGPRPEACMFSFDKYLTKLFAKNIGVKTLAYELLHKNDKRELKTAFPCIIKPLRLGSSIGLSVVKEASELDYALDVAFEFDDAVLIEPFIAGIKEYNLAGCKTDDFVFSIVEEPQKKEFLDFDKKYLDFSRSATIEDAEVSEALRQKLQDTFVSVYENMFEGSLIRCDFFERDGEVYLNEINPIPGSFANYLFKDFHDVVNTLAKHLPNKHKIGVDYKYIHSINAAKGK